MNVQLLDVQLNQTLPTKAGGSWLAHVIKYKNSEGKLIDRPISVKAPFAGTVTSLKSGDNVELTFKKEGQYFNLVGLEKGGKAASSGGSYSRRSSDLGMRIGNITNNAALIYANKLASSLTEAIDVVLEAQTYIESRLEGKPAAESSANFNLQDDDGEISF